MSPFLAFAGSSPESLSVWSTNGGYNLFGGNDPYSFDWLKNNYNAEYSLADALPWCGVKFDNAYNVAENDFVRCTLKFIKEDPGQFVALVLYKAYTMLFRPNLRLAEHASKSDRAVCCLGAVNGLVGFVLCFQIFCESHCPA